MRFLLQELCVLRGDLRELCGETYPGSYFNHEEHKDLHEVHKALYYRTFVVFVKTFVNFVVRSVW